MGTGEFNAGDNPAMTSTYPYYPLGPYADFNHLISPRLTASKQNFYSTCHETINRKQANQIVIQANWRTIQMAHE